MAIQKTEIDKNKLLNPGDRIEMHFSTTGMVWLTAAQIALIERRLESRKDFTILSHSLPANNKVIFTIEVLKTNPVVITAAVIGAAVIGAGVVAWLTLDKVYQIIESPTGKAVVGSTAIGVAAIAILALAGLSKK
jgi:fucose 4-O-acetylase-like acetyltransferase